MLEQKQLPGVKSSSKMSKAHRMLFRLIGQKAQVTYEEAFECLLLLGEKHTEYDWDGMFGNLDMKVV